ncbi:glycerol kinase GlpK [Streptomonospora nanhaiensis]|uniref:glycerol kinase n=1 Tax=Streptomonospora nanhaiensis TaxID=1323731 RepID=A0A853BI06_9ACTN|nr:glycerol kinase GlpK [Streptomonospora nanhaiensis]MBV2362420.1 glycerol kinase GlpK [Streptomonospora nanhaiensis]MBX9389191.1 glycerol kinase GlpK [Streptomonospora nanhaiensis]NYI94923.1 glycerol kinase [Streptomonospora nanhaiensis]
MTVLAIDAGTTGVTALIVDENGAVLARGYQEFAQHYPESGWVEHVPEEIWQATLSACQTALDGTEAQPTCIGITNQRETAVLWSRKRGGAPRRAIVWQDRRTAGICAELRDAGHEERVTQVTGLRLDPYFTATKLTWMSRNDKRAWSGVESGDTVAGTVDSYIISRMTAGARHVTDASNASRTLLYDINEGRWSEEMCELFGVPVSALPEVVPSYGTVGETDPEEFLGLRLPVAGIAGDQQAAMFGQNCYTPGSSKCTYGTGSFVLVNTGESPVAPEHGLLSTVLWQHPDGRLEYALEGSIFVTGAAVQWLRDGLGLIDTAAQTEGLAASVRDSGGVVFVPALTGLGAPDWDPHARGAIFGITRGTGRAHIARATLEAIAFEVRDVAEAMARASGTELPELRVDGGASANNLLCQIQADQLQVSVARPEVQETTALGAAFLAGLGTGVWSSTDELTQTWNLDRRFEPGERDEGAHRRWRAAVERTKGWADIG